jgi:hypothetical protein
MKLPDEHGGAMVNGSVRLELRDVAIGVPAAAWQLACEGVCAREHARAPFGQGEQGSTPLGAGTCVSRTPEAKESGPARRRLTKTTHYAAGTPSCEQKITVKSGACLATMRRSVAKV